MLSMSTEDDDDDLDAEFQKTVASLGGASEIRRKSQVAKINKTATEAKRSVDRAAQQMQLTDGGWALTVGFLALVVALAFFQSTRIDPSNY